jgi:ATP-dependent Clp protease protease subunit
MPNSRIMIHSASGGYQGKIADARIYLEEMNHQNETLLDILAERTGKDKEQIRRDSERDKWLSAREACDYGLIDTIVNGQKVTRLTG